MIPLHNESAMSACEFSQISRHDRKDSSTDFLCSLACPLRSLRLGEGCSLSATASPDGAELSITPD